MNKVQNDLNLSQETDNSPISINKNLLNKENNNSFNWLTDHSRSFLSAGYIQEGVSAEERIMEIERAENILNIKGFKKSFTTTWDKVFTLCRLQFGLTLEKRGVSLLVVLDLILLMIWEIFYTANLKLE